VKHLFDNDLLWISKFLFLVTFRVANGGCVALCSAQICGVTLHPRICDIKFHTLKLYKNF